MKDTEINAKVRNAFSGAVPDVLDSVLSDCREQKGTVVLMTERKKNGRWAKFAAGIAACLVLLLGGGFGLRAYNINYSVDSTVSLDVNPSIQISVNEKERVLEVIPLNDDARVVIGDMDFSGSDIDVAVNALIGSMLRNGYLSEMANSILISVDGSDPVKSGQLQQRLAQEVSSLLQTDSFSGSVLSQTITDDASLSAMAEAYGITVGKAQLIQEILNSSVGNTFEELAPLSINELNLILSTGNTAGTIGKTVSTVGDASDKAYIGEDVAKEIALADAGVAESSLTKYEWDIDTERGVLVYEIEFGSGGYEYDYDINALTGEIVGRDSEWDDDYRGSSPAQTPSGGAGISSSAEVTEEQTRAAALAHAGVSESEVVYIKSELDYDDGILLYEIEFLAGAYEYEYEIDAGTGAILKSDWEYFD